MSAAIAVDGDQVLVDFEAFDLDAYGTFLRAKGIHESRLAYDHVTAGYRLTAPARFAGQLGADVVTSMGARVPLAPHLFDYQQWIVERALAAKRFAIWADTGLGKTAMFLEWARQVVAMTGGRVVILSPLQVITQTIEEAERFYGGRMAALNSQLDPALDDRVRLHAERKAGRLPVRDYLDGLRRVREMEGELEALRRELGATTSRAFELSTTAPTPTEPLSLERLTSRADLADWCSSSGPGIAISNYEKLTAGILDELRRCAGVVLDESSILKSGGGTIKWNLIKSCRGVEYKLSCTATPAPNDTMEYAAQASFLEKLRSEGDILWTYFSRDKHGTWRVKPHAREAFYRFMSQWSIYLRDPAHYGFGDILKDLPAPDWHEHTIRSTEAQRAAMNALMVENGKGLFEDRQGVRERSKLSQIAKGFMYEGTGKDRTARRIASDKPLAVVELVLGELEAGRQVLVWTVFDEESEILARYLPADRAQVLHGSTPPAERQQVLDRFRAGDVDVLISKAQLVGYGLNFQHCTSMVFSGFDDSFERLYQAVRRCYRFGQTETVHVHVPVIPELEGLMLDNLKKKQAQFERDVAIQEANYRDALAGVLP